MASMALSSFSAMLRYRLNANTNPAYRNGHGCMLQYALLHLFGYGVSMDDLKNFRVSKVDKQTKTSAV